jgi:hypothetical protein
VRSLCWVSLSLDTDAVGASLGCIGATPKRSVLRRLDLISRWLGYRLVRVSGIDCSCIKYGQRYQVAETRGSVFGVVTRIATLTLRFAKSVRIKAMGHCLDKGGMLYCSRVANWQRG